MSVVYLGLAKYVINIVETVSSGMMKEKKTSGRVPKRSFNTINAYQILPVAHHTQTKRKHVSYGWRRALGVRDGYTVRTLAQAGAGTDGHLDVTPKSIPSGSHGRPPAILPRDARRS